MTPVVVTVNDLAEQMGKSRNTLMEWSRRATDPLPVRYMHGTSTYGFILVDELNEWISRNSGTKGGRNDK